MPTTSARLLTLLSLLQARRDWPGGLLAERLDVSPRTVRRDVDRLRELGYPITAVKGPDGGYRLSAGADLPPLLFDDEQAVALAVALQLGATSGAGIDEAATRALATVRQVMPARLRHRIDGIQVTTARRPDADGAAPLPPTVLTALTDAVHAREVLRFDYAGPAQPTGVAPPARRVEPHQVLTWGGRWYLVAWDLDRSDWRVFRADRITPRIPTGPRFSPRTPPGGSATAFLISRFRGSDATGEWPCRGEVILDLPVTEVAPYTGEAVVEPVGPSRSRVVMGAWSWAGLAATLGRFDGDIEVVGPPELKQAFGRLARRFARAAE